MPKRKSGESRDFIDRARTVQDLRRVSENTRIPKRTILVVCEGKKTEPLSLQRHFALLEAEGGGDALPAPLRAP